MREPTSPEPRSTRVRAVARDGEREAVWTPWHDEKVNDFKMRVRREAKILGLEPVHIYTVYGY